MYNHAIQCYNVCMISSLVLYYYYVDNLILYAGNTFFDHEIYVALRNRHQ